VPITGGAGRLLRPDDLAAPLFRPEAARGLLLAVEGDEWVGVTHVLWDGKTPVQVQAKCGGRNAAVV